MFPFSDMSRYRKPCFGPRILLCVFSLSLTLHVAILVVHDFSLLPSLNNSLLLSKLLHGRVEGVDKRRNISIEANTEWNDLSRMVRQLSAVALSNKYHDSAYLYDNQTNPATLSSITIPTIGNIRQFLKSQNVKNTGVFDKNYIINEPFRCRYEDDIADTFLVSLILSHPLNKYRRDAIRDTWGSISRRFGSTLPVRTLFILGMDSDAYTNNRVFHESNMYRDILQIDMVDTYSRLTTKTVVSLKWVLSHCTAAKFVLKTDDDTMVNTNTLLRILQNTSHGELLLGSINGNGDVMRTGRWGVTLSQYPFSTFPPYLNGAAYVVSMATVASLYQGALRTPLIHLEDVFVTGFIPVMIGLNLTGLNGFANWATRVTSPCQMKNQRLVTAHGVLPEMMYAIWKANAKLYLCGYHDHNV